MHAIMRLKASGMRPSEIVLALGISRSTYHDRVADAKAHGIAYQPHALKLAQVDAAALAQAIDEP